MNVSLGMTVIQWPDQNHQHLTFSSRFPSHKDHPKINQSLLLGKKYDFNFGILVSDLHSLSTWKSIKASIVLLRTIAQIFNSIIIKNISVLGWWVTLYKLKENVCHWILHMLCISVMWSVLSHRCVFVLSRKIILYLNIKSENSDHLLALS